MLALLDNDAVRGRAALDRALILFPADARLTALRDRLRAADAARRAPTVPGRVEIPLRGGVATTRVEFPRAGSYEFIVDTGASVTTIPPVVADRLGLRRQGGRPVTLTTASGQVESVIVRIPELRFGSIVLRDVPAAILDLPGRHDGLLGLEALKRLHVEIDDQRSLLVIEQRRRR